MSDQTPEDLERLALKFVASHLHAAAADVEELFEEWEFVRPTLAVRNLWQGAHTAKELSRQYLRELEKE